ncbi:MAG: hypothetical protein GY861_21550 [bacterium]|nr:hypothetical protein [bacterium]
MGMVVALDAEFSYSFMCPNCEFVNRRKRPISQIESYVIPIFDGDFKLILYRLDRCGKCGGNFKVKLCRTDCM